MRDRIFCDSNIFLYAFSNQDEKKQTIATKIITSKSIISTQVINEVSNNMIKKFKMDNDFIRDFSMSCYERYEVIDISKDIFVLACELRYEFNLSYYDSIIVSSAIDSNCTILYSEDMQHRQVIKKLEIINPFIKY